MKTTKTDKYIFFDESGTGGDNLYLGIGVVVTSNPAEIHEKCDQIRKQYKFFNEIKFEKYSRKRAEINDQFLKVFKDSECYFKAVIVNKKEVGWERFNILADDLINSAIKNGQPS